MLRGPTLVNPPFPIYNLPVELVEEAELQCLQLDQSLQDLPCSMEDGATLMGNRVNLAPSLLDPKTFISPKTNVAQVFNGHGSTIFLRNDGTAWATGRNDYGQLGVGDNTNRSNPTQVILEDGTPLTNVAQVHHASSITPYFFETMGLYGPQAKMIMANWVWGMTPIDTTQPRSS